MSQDLALKPTGRIFGGLVGDLKRKAPFYLSDFRDGLSSKVAGTTLFLYFAVLANAIAFGALTGVLTDGQIGISEMFVVTAVGRGLRAFFRPTADDTRWHGTDHDFHGDFVRSLSSMGFTFSTGLCLGGDLGGVDTSDLRGDRCELSDEVFYPVHR